MPDYKLKDAASKLGAKPQRFTFFKGSKGTEVVISVGAPKAEVMKSVNLRIGPSRPDSKGTCYKDEKGVIIFATKELSKEAVIRQAFSKGGVSTKLVFRAPKPEEEKLEESEGESSGEQEQPLTTGAPVLPVPNRPPPQPPTASTPPRATTPTPGGDTASAPMVRRNATTTPPTVQTTPPITRPTPQRPIQPPGGSTTPTPTTTATARTTTTTATTPPARTLPPAAKAEIGSKFSKTKMDQVKAATDRGFFKGMGEFKEVFKGVEGLQVAETKLKQAAKGQPLDAKSVTFLISRYDALLAKVDEYQDKFYDDGTAKLPSRKRKESKDQVRDDKLAFSKEARAAAVEARTHLKHPDKVTALETLTQKNATTGLTDREERTFHQTRAELMMLSREGEDVEKAEGGTSDVKVLRNFDGSVGYVFKSIEGESKQMKVAKGAGTAQEILTSKASEVIKRRCGFDSGFPKTTLAMLPGTGGEGSTQGAPGALIEGIPGTPFVELAEYAPMDKYDAMSVDEKKEADDRSRAAGVWDGDGASSFYSLFKKEQNDKALAIPPATVQKILLSNLMSASADIKWSNVMTDGPNARPFDGGGCMLSEEKFMESAQARRSAGAVKSGDIAPLFGTTMLFLPDGATKHPAASQPMDAEAVRQILSLDPDEVEADMTAEINELKSANSDLDGAVDGSNVKSSRRSLEALQAVLRRNPTATMEEFLNGYNEEVKTWLNEVKNRS